MIDWVKVRRGLAATLLTGALAVPGLVGCGGGEEAKPEATTAAPAAYPNQNMPVMNQNMPANNMRPQQRTSNAPRQVQYMQQQGYQWQPRGGGVNRNRQTFDGSNTRGHVREKYER